MANTMKTDASPYAALTADMPSTGPSFTAALFGFLSTTVATTMLLLVLGNL